jgi:lipoprotein NlpI
VLAIQLNPKDANAYRIRGAAYFGNGQYDQAIVDENQAIQLNPKDADIYDIRGIAYFGKGQYDPVVADESQAIQLNPKDAEAYYIRGIANLYSGNLAKALADESQATAFNPEYAYAALWLDIVGQRNNVPSNLSQAISRIDMTAWPASIIRMFLGQLTPAAARAAADDPDATKKTEQVCEANFYGGELALRAGGKDEATRLFHLASSGCPKGYIEFAAANAELRVLGVAP